MKNQTCTNCGGELVTEQYQDMTTGTPVKMAVTRCTSIRWGHYSLKFKKCPVVKVAVDSMDSCFT